jgi:hypothetical protein
MTLAKTSTECVTDLKDLGGATHGPVCISCTKSELYISEYYNNILSALR